jgi:hypothetical protein
MEIHARDLLVYYLAASSATDAASWSEALHLQEKTIEGVEKRGLDFGELLRRLSEAKVISPRDKEQLSRFYKEIRNPIQHGLSRRLVFEKADPAWEFLGPLLESPDRRIDKLDSLVTSRAEEIASTMINFMSRRTIPRSPVGGKLSWKNKSKNL